MIIMVKRASRSNRFAGFNAKTGKLITIDGTGQRRSVNRNSTTRLNPGEPLQVFGNAGNQRKDKIPVEERRRVVPKSFQEEEEVGGLTTLYEFITSLDITITDASSDLYFEENPGVFSGFDLCRYFQSRTVNFGDDETLVFNSSVSSVLDDSISTGGITLTNTLDSLYSNLDGDSASASSSHTFVLSTTLTGYQITYNATGNVSSSTLTFGGMTLPTVNILIGGGSPYLINGSFSVNFSAVDGSGSGFTFNPSTGVSGGFSPTGFGSTPIDFNTPFVSGSTSSSFNSGSESYSGGSLSFSSVGGVVTDNPFGPALDSINYSFSATINFTRVTPTILTSNATGIIEYNGGDTRSPLVNFPIHYFLRIAGEFSADVPQFSNFQFTREVDAFLDEGQGNARYTLFSDIGDKIYYHKKRVLWQFTGYTETVPPNTPDIKDYYSVNIVDFKVDRLILDKNTNLFDITQYIHPTVIPELEDDWTKEWTSEYFPLINPTLSSDTGRGFPTGVDCIDKFFLDLFVLGNYPNFELLDREGTETTVFSEDANVTDFGFDSSDPETPGTEFTYNVYAYEPFSLSTSLVCPISNLGSTVFQPENIINEITMKYTTVYQDTGFNPSSFLSDAFRVAFFRVPRTFIQSS